MISAVVKIAPVTKKTLECGCYGEVGNDLIINSDTIRVLNGVTVVLHHVLLSLKVLCIL